MLWYYTMRAGILSALENSGLLFLKGFAPSSLCHYFACYGAGFILHPFDSIMCLKAQKCSRAGRVGRLSLKRARLPNKVMRQMGDCSSGSRYFATFLHRIGYRRPPFKTLFCRSSTALLSSALIMPVSAPK